MVKGPVSIQGSLAKWRSASKGSEVQVTGSWRKLITIIYHFYTIAKKVPKVVLPSKGNEMLPCPKGDHNEKGNTRNTLANSPWRVHYAGRTGTVAVFLL